MAAIFPTAERRRQLQEALEGIVERLKTLDVEKIILFGSMARSGPVCRSADLDLIVVMRTEARFLDRLELVYQTAAPTVSCDLLVYTPEEMERLPARSGFLRKALREGRVLYEKRGPSGSPALA